MGCSSSEKPRPAADVQFDGAAARSEATTPKQAANAGGEAASEPEWGKTIASARQEGKVVLSGPPGEVWRRALRTFEQDFPDIQVEYTGDRKSVV